MPTTYPPYYISETGLRVVLLGLLIALSSGHSAYAQWQDLAALRNAAEHFVLNLTRGLPGNVRVSVANPESRLQLPACGKLIAFAPAGARYWGSASVGVRCESPSAWSLYVPVSVHVIAEAAVSTRAIQKGQQISASDVTLQESDLTQLPLGSITALDQIIGRTAKTNIAGGMAIRGDQLKPPPLIAQGENVQLAYAGEGFEVHGTGRALTAGGLGESVDVRSASGRTLKGVVRGKGWVAVH